MKHFQEEGIAWTKKYKPIKILSQITGDEFDEEKITLIAIEKYGIDNVRGGSYCTINLSQHEKDKALQTIRSITDKCYTCGLKGHYAKDCKPSVLKNCKVDTKEPCEMCGDSGKSYWCNDIYGSCLECCCIDCGKKNENCSCR